MQDSTYSILCKQRIERASGERSESQLCPSNLHSLSLRFDAESNGSKLAVGQPDWIHLTCDSESRDRNPSNSPSALREAQLGLETCSSKV